MPRTKIELTNGRIADLAKSQFGVIFSCDGEESGYHEPYVLNTHLSHFQREDVETHEAYGAEWIVTEAGESEYRYMGEESPRMVECDECDGEGVTGEQLWSTFQSDGHYGPCGKCWGRGEFNDSPWLRMVMVKCVGLLGFEGLLDFWNDEGFMRGTVGTMGALGTATPEGMTFGWMPAFALESDAPESILSAYVTPYPYTADGEPIADLSDADFDAMVEGLEQYREAVEQERLDRIEERRAKSREAAR